MTTDKDGPRSNPYHPDPAQCCERCVFDRGPHAPWCAQKERDFLQYRRSIVANWQDSPSKTAVLNAIDSRLAHLSKRTNG